MWPPRLMSGRPVAGSQSLTSPWSLPTPSAEAIRVPSGLNATQLTQPLWPFHSRIDSPVAESQSRIVPGLPYSCAPPAEARCRPSGLNATLRQRLRRSAQGAQLGVTQPIQVVPFEPAQVRGSPGRAGRNESSRRRAVAIRPFSQSCCARPISAAYHRRSLSRLARRPGPSFRRAWAAKIRRDDDPAQQREQQAEPPGRPPRSSPAPPPEPLDRCPPAAPGSARPRRNRRRSSARAAASSYRRPAPSASTSGRSVSRSRLTEPLSCRARPAPAPGPA